MDSSDSSLDFLRDLLHELKDPFAALYGGLELVAQASALGAAEKERLEGSLRRNSHAMKRVLEEASLYLRLLGGGETGQRLVVEPRAPAAEAVDDVRSQLETREQSVALLGPSLRAELDATTLRHCLGSMLGSMSRYCSFAEAIELSWSVLPEQQRLRYLLGVPGRAPRPRGEAVDFREKMALQLADLMGATLRRVALDSWELEVPFRAALGADTSSHLPDETEQKPGRTRILVVDDNRDGADTLALWLSARGFEAITAYDGESALLEFERSRPDVGLFDVGLPRRNGYELAQEVRRWGFRGPLIAITGYGQDTDKARALESGFDHHLLKPVDPPQLERLLRELEARATHVLVVEDNLMARQVVLRMLGNLGARATAAGTAQEGLDVIERDPPTLAICDLGLPGELDGYDLARRVREAGGSFPLIALTGEVGAAREKALRAGFDQVLEKPVDEKTLRLLLAMARQQSEPR